MKRVIGIGGIFFKAENPAELASWYEEHLGVPIDKSFGGYSFKWNNQEQRPVNGYTLWSPFKEDTQYMKPSSKNFMFNFIVDDLERLLQVLESEGIDQVSNMQDTDFGKFAWIMDPENNKIELWEPLEE
ncbi:VOC family protein [Fodinibius halophilus]|uniref:VOC family protein n=1 Tax=Fodinibius halophilus TaxID=1736908 RepID=A0A6M1T4F4_9BACT|nr:VOC family protein [Fodinibius halophilus]NGP88927.1 VOC family protein [Fodinibius halophilus]